MKNIIKILSASSVLLVGLLFTTSSFAASQCSGLSNSACGSNSSCTWRKGSVDKNGKKTKSHCRALPNKGKKVSASKSSSAKSTANKSSAAKATSAKSSSKKTSTKSKAKKSSASSTSKSKSTKVKKAAKKKAKKSPK